MLIQVGGHPGIVQERGQYVLKNALNTETMFYETMYETSGAVSYTHLRAHET